LKALALKPKMSKREEGSANKGNGGEEESIIWIMKE